MYNLKNHIAQQHVEEIKPTLKINNSYESEPSSGSGSSLSENNDCNVYDDENIRLPFILKIPLPPKPRTPIQQPAMQSINSSQESPFHGFTDSPFGKIQQKIFNGTPKENNKSVEKLTSSQESSFHGFASSPEERVLLSKKKFEKPSPGKVTFPNFYDLLLENSNNAVDILLPQAKIAETTNHLDLSFNGKINNQNDALTELCDNTNITKTDMLTESSFNRKNCSSPDLFDDDDEDTTVEKAVTNVVVEESIEETMQAPSVEDAVTMLPLSLHSTTNTKPLNLEKLLQWNRRCEREMLRRTRKCLSGVPPPPSMTILQMNLFEEISNKKTAILDFFNQIQRKDEKSGIKTDDLSNSPNCSYEESTQARICLLKPTHSLEETKSMKWKDVLAVRQHGLSYNLNKASEDNDQLSLAVVERFVGAETASSYRCMPSSEQKRQSRLKLLTQSPGSRLSHLAKRRSVFSSANLANNSQKSLGPQILVDRVKTKARRRGSGTPNSKKKRKTPTSARKSIYRCDLKKPGPTRETSKRALFQSPAKQLLKVATITRPLQMKPEIATRVEKSKRALFSPDKTQNQLNPLENLLKRKRSNVDSLADDEDSSLIQNNKLFRGGNEVITPRTLKIKSQSFCIGAQSTHAIVSETVAFASNQLNLQMMNCHLRGQQNTPSILQRTQSEMTVQSYSLTENQRKKLLWAVSQALQERKISTKHAKFRDFAAVLARIVRRLFQEYYQKSSTSNSETMLKLAKKYAYQVISGRQADNIYMEAKEEINEKVRASRARFSGYIGPEEYEKRKLDLQICSEIGKTASLQNIYTSENSMDVCWSGTSQSQISQKSTEKPIQPNSALQNSSSKNNLGLVLRENALDGNEQRRSAQKNSASKDGNLSARKSVNPTLLGSGCKLPTTTPNLVANISKAKRNINFE